MTQSLTNMHEHSQSVKLTSERESPRRHNKSQEHPATTFCCCYLNISLIRAACGPGPARPGNQGQFSAEVFTFCHHEPHRPSRVFPMTLKAERKCTFITCLFLDDFSTFNGRNSSCIVPPRLGPESSAHIVKTQISPNHK